ncbi:hypothetical protein [Companilactobacillus furfuricola]|uniref:hypothetical protein n=1 Tax=Companilactobacillus furfuricola TaxID=1462575 RepID=UPI0013DDB0B4|nr:hypothetical protein [Companilactobacillus furfuricola]
MRKQEVKAKEEKMYQLLSNQQNKRKHQQQCKSGSKMSGAKSRELRKKSVIRIEKTEE